MKQTESVSGTVAVKQGLQWSSRTSTQQRNSHSPRMKLSNPKEHTEERSSWLLLEWKAENTGR